MARETSNLIGGSSMRVFEQLGATVEARWRDQDYNEDAFAPIATEALIASKVLLSVTREQIVDWFMAGRVPVQQFRNFGQPPLNIYVGHNFIIELLFWLDSTTSIHQHGFAGAFGVLEGSSLHSHYHFQCEDRVCFQILLGQLSFKSAEVLERGDVRTILAGDRFIHSLFHLDCPSVSVVVRMTTPANYSPQYAYLRPGIAIDPFYEPEPLMTQLRLLTSLRSFDTNLFWRCAHRLVKNADFWTAFKVLQLCYEGDTQEREVHRILVSARKRFPNRAFYLLAALRNQAREARIVEKRAVTRRADHRYFLALLLNLPDKCMVVDFMRKRFPKTESEKLMDEWARELNLNYVAHLAAAYDGGGVLTSADV